MKYAHFDKGHRVVGWFDTETHNYELPDSSTLIEVTDEQWANRHHQAWRVSGDRLQACGPSPEESFEIMRKSRIDMIWKECEKEIAKGVEVDGVHYAADPLAFLWAPHGVPIRCDGKLAILPPEKANSVMAAYASLCATNRLRAQELVAKLADAKTAADISAVRW